METRVLNIIKRAVNEFGLKYKLEDTIEDVFCEAQNTIEDNVDYDGIAICERNNHYTHVSWGDGKGFDYEADGEFISSDDQHNRYFHVERDKFYEVEWWAHDKNDYILMDFVLDTDGNKIALIAK